VTRKLTEYAEERSGRREANDRKGNRAATTMRQRNRRSERGPEYEKYQRRQKGSGC
jgi:hypothetical protein